MYETGGQWAMGNKLQFENIRAKVGCKCWEWSVRAWVKIICFYVDGVKSGEPDKLITCLLLVQKVVTMFMCMQLMIS